jgi:hypothetical protein
MFGHLRFEMSKSSAEGLMASGLSEALKLRAINSAGWFEFRTEASTVFILPFS